MTRNASETPTFEHLIFFFVRQNHPSIKQITFQKHCLKGTAHHGNLYILYQKAINLPCMR